MDIQPVNSISLGGMAPTATKRTFNMTGSPSRSPSSEMDDVKHTLHKLLDGDIIPDKANIVESIKSQLIDSVTNRSLDEIVAFQKDILEKEINQIRSHAEETGDWSFFLRAAEKRKGLDEISNTSE